MKKSKFSKKNRHVELQAILATNPQGMSRSEIARMLDVNKSTITRDLQELSENVRLTELKNGKLRLEPADYRANVELSAQELGALHLSARMLARTLKFPFPYAAQALRKLAAAQERVNVVAAQNITATAEELESIAKLVTLDLDRHRRIVEQLSTAIGERRMLRVRLDPRSDSPNAEFELFPLTLEPHCLDRAVHLLFLEGNPGDLKFGSINIDYIEELSVLDALPETEQDLHAQIRRRLDSAWCVVPSESQPVEVSLRFDRSCARKVAESLWHSSQRLSIEEDGSIRWEGTVSDPQNMLPWIRSWGPDVEVLEPGWLREVHKADFLKGRQRYVN